MNDRWRFITARTIEILIGAVFLAAGGLKAWEPIDFVRQIGDYQILTNLMVVKLTAWLLIVIEISLGTALIVGYQRRWSVPVASLMLLTFLVTLGWAWYNGSTANCGCFGSWIERTPAEAFTEDLVMLIATGFAWWLHRLESTPLARWKPVTVAASTLLAITLTTYAGNSARQSDDPIERMRAASTAPRLLAGLKVEGLHDSLDQGQRIVVLLDTGCEHCQASVPELNRLNGQLQTLNLPLVALCSNQPDEIAGFVSRFGAEFPLGKISSDDFRRLFERGRPPRLLLFKDGELLRVWDGVVPPLTEVQQVIG